MKNNALLVVAIVLGLLAFFVNEARLLLIALGVGLVCLEIIRRWVIPTLRPH